MMAKKNPEPDMAPLNLAQRMLKLSDVALAKMTKLGVFLPEDCHYRGILARIEAAAKNSRTSIFYELGSRMESDAPREDDCREPNPGWYLSKTLADRLKKRLEAVGFTVEIIEVIPEVYTRLARAYEQLNEHARLVSTLVQVKPRILYPEKLTTLNLRVSWDKPLA